MKLNKSILGIALVLVFLLGACSQARYGNLTRRTKATHLAQKEVKKEFKTPQVITPEMESNVESTQAEDAIQNENVEFVSEVMPIEVKETSTPNYAQNVSKITESKAFKMAGPLQKRAVKKVLAKLDKKVANAQPSEVNDDSSLLRLILIIVLVLLILSLIGKLLPGLEWLIGVLLLIVLIWLILQYI